MSDRTLGTIFRGDGENDGGAEDDRVDPPSGP